MMELDRLHGIADDIDRTVWGRELAAALHSIAAGIGEKVDEMSRVGEYESNVLAWVEKNGGLEAVKERTMPEDMSWPFYEDGEPVRLGEHWQQDGYDWSITSIDSIEFAEDGVRFENECADAFYRYGERVKRPAPPVLDADGVEIRVGDTVWSVNSGLRYTVEKVAGEFIRIECRSEIGTKVSLFPLQLTHRAPVLAADGEPLEAGQTVWDTNGDELVIGALEDGGYTVTCRYADVGDSIPVHGMWSPSDLTHQRPALDADGVPIHEGDTVYGFAGQQYEVTGLCEYEPGIVHAKTVGDGVAADELLALSGQLNSAQLDASKLIHRAPVLDADGEPIHEGDMVYDKDTGDRFEVDGFSYNGVVCTDIDACESDIEILPSQLTHTKPEPDSWGSVWADVSDGHETPEGMMRRCRALVERGE